MSLAERIQFETAFLCTGLCQYGQRPVVKDETVWVVIAYHDSMPASEIDQSRIQIFGCRSTGRHVRIVCPHYLHSIQVHVLQGFKIRLPAVLRLEVISHDFGLDQSGC